MKHFSFILVWLFTSLLADAAEFKFQHLNTSYGLPNQQVESLVQDEEGYIWIGTRNGLARYDVAENLLIYKDSLQNTYLMLSIPTMYSKVTI